MMTKNEIYLDKIHKEDLKTIEEWLNNEQFLKFYHYEIIQKKAYKDLKKLYLNADRNKYVPKAVRMKDQEKIVGLTELFDISHKNRTAWVSVGIGEDRFKGKGIGKKAMELVIDEAFYQLNLRKLQLTVIAYNERAIRLYESLGFVREGTFRKAVLYENKEYDLYLYGMLKDEWK